MRLLHRATDGFHYPVVIFYLLAATSAVAMWIVR